MSLGSSQKDCDGSRLQQRERNLENLSSSQNRAGYATITSSWLMGSPDSVQEQKVKKGDTIAILPAPGGG